MIDMSKVPITEKDIDLIGDEVGMGSGGWDMVDPPELIRAVLKVMVPVVCRTTPGKCFCGCHVSQVMEPTEPEPMPEMIYSIGDFDKHDKWVDSDRDKVVVQGKAKVVAERDEFWGGPESQRFESEVLTNPTHDDIFKIAQQAMAATRDFHHVYYEGCGVKNVVEGITVLELYLGS